MNIKKQIQCPIIYVTSLDKKDVAYVIAIFSLKMFLVHAVPQNSGQNLEAKEYGSSVDLQCKMHLEAIITGT